MNDAIAPPPLPTETAVPVAFTGVRGEFRRLIMRGAMLELVTLGFYRFWLATDMRRHFWSHTSVGGDAPEYTGTAKELLIGFLIALAILVPIYVVYFLIGLEAERLQAFASIPLILFFYLFFQFAMYRARRYRLTRTIWRGVRFWMKGSGWLYALQAGLWMLLVIITAGLALPWYQAALERYKLRNSFYGDLQGRFDATGGALFKQIWWLWVVTVLAFILVGGLATALPPAAGLFSMLVMVWGVFAYAIYKACEWRWWLSGIRFGDVRFESKLTTGALFGLYWKVIGWSMLILAMLIAWLGAVFGSFFYSIGGSGASEQTIALTFQSTPFLVAVVAGYLVCALAFGVVVRLYLRRDIWALSLIHI